MKALQIQSPRHVEIIETPAPRIERADQVLIRIRATSICNSHEWKTYTDHYRTHFKAEYPCRPGYPGHEGCGEIVDVGDDVHDLSAGDQVFLTSHAGELHKEYVVCSAGWAFRVDPPAALGDVAPLELFACAVGLLSTGKHVAGCRCAVIGVGPGGLAVVQVLRALGAGEIIAIDLVDSRLDLALGLGAHRIIRASDSAEIDAAIKAGIETAIDCSGTHDGFRLIFRAARREAILFGYNDQPFETVQADWFIKQLVIRTGNIIEQETGRRTAELLRQGLIRPSALVTHRVPFTAAGYSEAMELIEQRVCGKILMLHDAE